MLENFLAQSLSATSASSSSSGSVVKMIVALAVVLAVTGILMGVLSIIRRRTHEQGSHAPRGFTLGDLRDLRREGKLTEDEFERAKAKLVSGVQSTLKKEVKRSMVDEPIGEELK